MQAKDLATQIDRYIDNYGKSGEIVATDLPHLTLLRHKRPTTFESVLYNPVVCLILQGRKETAIGDRAVSFGPGESLIVSHDLPVVSRVTEATSRMPYLSLILTLDLAIVRSLYDQVGEAELEEGRASPLDVNDADAALVDALARYFTLAGQAVEARVMGPLILKEIHFRLLMAPNGGMLRRLLRRDSHASRIAIAIAQIRRDYRTALTVSDLAKTAGMSPSSFHEHFKSITATTPLQYQKELRLIEARRLLSEGGHSVAAVAFEVGYESPTQFSREYARKFGTSPRDAVGVAVAAA